MFLVKISNAKLDSNENINNLCKLIKSRKEIKAMKGKNILRQEVRKFYTLVYIWYKSNIILLI